jgi:hypothetical protein
MGCVSRGGRRIAMGLSSMELYYCSLQSSKRANETEIELMALISRVNK